MSGPGFKTRSASGSSSPSTLSAFLNGWPVVSGKLTDSLQLPIAVVNNPNYTLLHLARYNDSSVYVPGPFGSCNRMIGE